MCLCAQVCPHTVKLKCRQKQDVIYVRPFYGGNTIFFFSVVTLTYDPPPPSYDVMYTVDCWSYTTLKYQLHNLKLWVNHPQVIAMGSVGSRWQSFSYSSKAFCTPGLVFTTDRWSWAYYYQGVPAFISHRIVVCCREVECMSSGINDSLAPSLSCITNVRTLVS